MVACTTPRLMASATSVTGIIFNLSGTELAGLADLCEVPGPGGVPRLGNVSIYGASDVPDQLAAKVKAFPLVAVVAKVTNLPSPGEAGPGPSRISWRGRQAVLCETNPQSWDVLLTVEG